MYQQLTPLEKITVDHPAANISIIWLHGLGADGHDFEGIVPQLKDLGLQPATRFLFPHAPIRPITLNNGYQMRAWYDIYGLSSHTHQDKQGIQTSAEIIGQLIQEEQARGMASEQIILGGFSQGGALALYTALCHPQPLGGVIALSTYLPLADEVVSQRSAANQHIPIFMAHGQMDTVIPLSWAEYSYKFLAKLGYRIEWHSYPMEHHVCLEEMQAITAWLNAITQPA